MGTASQLIICVVVVLLLFFFSFTEYRFNDLFHLPYSQHFLDPLTDLLPFVYSGILF